MTALDDLKVAAIEYTIQLALEEGALAEPPVTTRQLEASLKLAAKRRTDTMVYDLACTVTQLQTAAAKLTVETRRTREAVSIVHTYAIMEVSAATYTEVMGKLKAAEYTEAIHDTDKGVVLDMHGIALSKSIPVEGGVGVAHVKEHEHDPDRIHKTIERAQFVKQVLRTANDDTRRASEPYKYLTEQDAAARIFLDGLHAMAVEDRLITSAANNPELQDAVMGMKWTPAMGDFVRRRPSKEIGRIINIKVGTMPIVVSWPDGGVVSYDAEELTPVKED